MRNLQSTTVGRPRQVDESKLLDVAERLFARHGYEGTSLRDLAAEAACNSALVAYYFGSKTGLYQAVLTRLIERSKVSFRSTEQKKLGDEKDFFESIFALACSMYKNRKLNKIIVREMMAGGTSIIDALKKSDFGVIGLLRQKIMDLQKRKIISDAICPKFTAIIILNSIFHSTISISVIEKTYGFKKIDEKYFEDLCWQLTALVFSSDKRTLNQKLS